jgi:hypothetical protein
MRLYNDPEKQERECSKCHQIKPYTEFKNRSDFPHIKRSICKKCNIKLEAHRLQMMSWINKIHAIRFVTNDLNECQICNDIGIENLPMLDFHHPDPELSTNLAREKGFWKSIRYKSWSIIRSELIRQKVIVICRNCHTKKNATYFNQNKDLILEIDNPNMILSTAFSTKYARDSIKAYIKKKLIFLNLWDGKCIKCGYGISIFNIDNLPALSIHHQTQNLKQIRLPFFHLLMSDADLERIKSILISEDCTSLCCNCHIMEQSTFFIEYKKQIFFKYKEKY